MTISSILGHIDSGYMTPLEFWRSSLWIPGQLSGSTNVVGEHFSNRLFGEYALFIKCISARVLTCFRKSISERPEVVSANIRFNLTS